MEKKTERNDAERRTRQCERLSRLLRVLGYISGSGRWDAEALAKDLECSTRTIHRLLQTLSHAGVPWYFDEELRAYRVRPGFKMAGDILKRSSSQTALINASKRLETEIERFLLALREFNRGLVAMPEK